jgi:hypothetical protein
VRLYSNLHQDLLNKDHKQREERGMRGGGGLTKNCKITIRIFGRKNQKKARTERHNVWRRRPCSTLYIPRSRALKRGESQNGDALN